ncbi:MAG: D-ribose pyranase [Anaerolineaceae bacterium]|nr:D-ribose pyranase [Anaerolineaceae bacterium]
MKNTTIINSDLISVMAQMGHRDELVLCDCGLPIPAGTRRIDLALTKGVPGFLPALDAILAELEVEEVIMAEEMKAASPAMHEAIVNKLQGVKLGYVSHEIFKQRSASAKACVRTGECTPYANLILIAASLF